MRVQLRTCALLLIVAASLASLPAFAQQEQGDKEIAINGAFIVPHDDPGSANGQADVKFGDYFRKNDLVGVETLAFIAKGFDEACVSGYYRHLFPTHNPRLFPFIGGAAGADLTRISGTPFGHVLLGKAEFGAKYFLNQRFAFEVSYNFEYTHNPGQSLAQNSDSAVLFGFSYVFGGHHKR